MRQLISILVWMFFFAFGHAQATFSKIISNYPLDPENAWTVAEVADGYIVVSAGECLGQDVIICGIVSKLDKNGNVVWFKQFDYYPNISSSLVIREDKIYVCSGSNQGDNQFVLYCSDMDGNLLWNREYGEPNKYEGGSTMAFTSDNHIVLCGVKKPNTAGMPSQVVYLIKTDIQGNIVDEHIYDFQNDQSLGRAVIETTDHQTIFSYDACPVSCFVEFSAGIASVDTSGTLNWNLEFPFSFQPDRPNIIQTGPSQLVANWHSQSVLPNHDWTPPTLFYLSLEGQIQDSLVFENQSVKKIDDLEPLWEKGLVGSGSNYIDYIASPVPIPGGWVFRVDENKEVLWDRTYTDTSFQGEAYKLQSIASTSDGGYIAVGTIDNNITGVRESHNWILKLDSLGCLQPGCGETNYITRTAEITFLKGENILVYPNPANSHVNIQFPADYPLNNLSAFLVSNSGKTIKKVVVSSIETRITLPDIGTGIYYLMVTRGNEIITSKRVVISKYGMI